MTYLDINQSKHQINNLFVFITFRFFSVPYINAYVAGSLKYPSHYKISNFLYVKIFIQRVVINHDTWKPRAYNRVRSKAGMKTLKQLQ